MIRNLSGNQPKVTALDEWKGHADRLDPRSRPRVGREPRLEHLRSLPQDVRPTLQSRAVHAAEAPKQSISIQKDSCVLIVS
jgi:hypothetical protein